MPDPKDSCFCCGKPLPDPLDMDNRGDPKTISAVDEGLVFRATGNYGSTIFDPMSEQFIEVLICDRCVVERQDRLRHWAEPGSQNVQAPPYKIREDRPVPDAEEQRLIDQAGGPEALEQIRREAAKAFPKGATVTVVPHEPIDHAAKLERIAEAFDEETLDDQSEVFFAMCEAAALIRRQAEQLAASKIPEEWHLAHINAIQKLATVSQDNDRLRKLLADVQWAGYVPNKLAMACVACKQHPHDGHAPDCPLKAALDGR